DLSYDRWTQLTYIFLGDPQLALWGAVPHSATLTLPPSVAVGDSTVTVSVKETTGSAPIANALGTLWKPTGGEEPRGMTGASGSITFPFRPSGTGTLLVTATHPSYLPRLDSLQVVAGRPDVAVSTVTVDDDSTGASLGNGDGIMDAGERV